MALPVLSVAAAIKILGPAAAKAAKLAYKMYKKRGGKKTEKKFLSDKANAEKKAHNKADRDIQKSELNFEKGRDESASGALGRLNKKEKKAYIKGMGFKGKNKPKTFSNKGQTKTRSMMKKERKEKDLDDKKTFSDL
tara:strand:+ start:291 stop:701 length:411 start_codon:yes stop_codon:yes gene_type:complete